MAAADAQDQRRPGRGVLAASIGIDGVEERAGLGQRFERLRGQERDLGLGVRLADALERRERQHHFADAAELDHQHPLDRLHRHGHTPPPVGGFSNPGWRRASIAFPPNERKSRSCLKRVTSETWCAAPRLTHLYGEGIRSVASTAARASPTNWGGPSANATLARSRPT